MLWSFLTTHNQHSLGQLLIFVNLYQQAKNHFILSVHFWVTVNFRVLSPDWKHPFLTMLTPNIFNHLLIVGICGPMQKIIPSLHSGDTVNLRVQWPDRPHPFLTMPNQKSFYWLLIFVNWYQNAKYYAVSGEMVDLKIL